ncbi:MAG TPA: alpha/beta hydrolase [Planctomycetota bacterium]|nr:alpha/beta hydrolase [Planctomycetota bacterium]
MRGFEILDSGEMLYVEESGIGPPLVCIHGLGGGAYFFSGMAEALKNRVRVIAFDLPGAGFSRRAHEPFSFERCAEMIVELAAKRAGGPFILLGHSLGTILALKVSARIPEGVRKIISVGGLPEALPLVKIRLRERAELIRKNGMPGIGDSALPVMLSEKSMLSMPDKVFLLRRLLEMTDAVGYIEMAGALAGASAIQEAYALRAPFFAITGSVDRYAPPAAVEAFLQTLSGPNRQIVLEECGHLPFFEQPEEFYRAVAECVEA